MYVPGENYPLPGGRKQIISGVVGKRRVLEVDEFEAYLSFLDDSDERVSLPVKAAIAVVLQADLKRLYGSEYPYNKIKLIDDWAGFYKGLSDLAKDIADSEIHAFEAYLVSRPSINPLNLHYYQQTQSQFDAFKLSMENDTLRFQSELARQRSINERNQFIERDMFVQKQNHTIDKMKSEMTKGDYAFNQRMRQFTKENIVDYLAGSFFRSPLAQRMNELKSDLEFDARQRIIEMVTNGSMLAIDGISLYDAYLSIIDKSKSIEDFKVLERGLVTRPVSHPLLRFL